MIFCLIIRKLILAWRTVEISWIVEKAIDFRLRLLIFCAQCTFYLWYQHWLTHSSSLTRHSYVFKFAKHIIEFRLIYTRLNSLSIKQIFELLFEITYGLLIFLAPEHQLLSMPTIFYFLVPLPRLELFTLVADLLHFFHSSFAFVFRRTLKLPQIRSQAGQICVELKNFLDFC